MDEMKIVYRGGTGEIEEKKSRFIANVFAVHTPEEAAGCVDACRKKYWDARHHCSAWIIGESGQTKRCSDDGEPSGTGGKPMLEVLTGQKVTDVCVVVTRYFGGTLLGTGGLVRAYSQAAAEGLKNSTLLTRLYGYSLPLMMSYSDLGKVSYILAEENCSTLNSEYGEEVRLEILVRRDDFGRLGAALTDGTGGRIRFGDKKEVTFAVMDSGPVIL